jgi:hypothetical protein
VVKLRGEREEGKEGFLRDVFCSEVHDIWFGGYKFELDTAFGELDRPFPMKEYDRPFP